MAGKAVPQTVECSDVRTETRDLRAVLLGYLDQQAEKAFRLACQELLEASLVESLAD